jgi:hypothetical protein
MFNCLERPIWAHVSFRGTCRSTIMSNHRFFFGDPCLMVNFFQVQQVGTFACSKGIAGLRRMDGTAPITCGAAQLQGTVGGIGGFFPLRSRARKQGPKPTTLRPCLTPSRKKISIQPTVAARPIQRQAGTLVRVAMLALFSFMGMAFGSVRNVGAHMATSSGGCEFPNLHGCVAMLSHGAVLYEPVAVRSPHPLLDMRAQ